ncbi:MAG: gfo/Idh/MocA family oxidoreductase, partial [Thermodesulfobacteriota bacterium]
TLEEADELIRISGKTGRYIQVGHLERFNPAVLAAADLVEDPLFIESHRLSIFKERGTDVSVVLDLMIHDIDLILHFVKSEINSIRASGMPIITGHVDIANARLEFINGCVANMTASRISMKNERNIRLFQHNRYLSVDFSNQDITIITRDGGQGDMRIPGMKVNRINLERGDALEEELKSFVRSVSLRTPPVVSGHVGREALKIALEIMKQIQIGCIPVRNK